MWGCPFFLFPKVDKAYLVHVLKDTTSVSSTNNEKASFVPNYLASNVKLVHGSTRIIIFLQSRRTGQLSPSQDGDECNAFVHEENLDFGWTEY